MPDFVPNRVPCGVKPEPQPIPPKPEPVTGLCDMRGVLYFKLDKKSVEEGGGKWFCGDRTKGCGLFGTEIDRNFYFLRAMDIKSANTVIENGRKYLVLSRFGCDWELKVDITDDSSCCDTEYKVEDGHIYVRCPESEWEPFIDAETGLPAKFLMEGDIPEIKVATDGTIDGDGKCSNPLSIDLAYRTGTYEPADYFMDLTCPDMSIAELPTDLDPGHAIVTKEFFTKFGRLYNYWEVEKLMADLAGNEDDCDWRVPTSEDWGKLLDWAEGCSPECQNHNADINKSNRGCQAGERLKSVEYWKECPGHEPVNEFGFSVYPVGMSPNSSNAKETAKEEYGGLGEVSAFWSQTEVGNEEYLTRVFSFAHDDVKLATKEKNEMLSLRLVKDVTGDESGDTNPGYVYILGNYVPVIQTTDGTQLWTALNVDFNNYSGFEADNVLVPEEWEGLDSEIAFFYNAWDGKRWRRKRMTEGETVSILYEDLESPCGTGATTCVTEENKNHEWKVFINEETGEAELIDIFSEIYQRLDELQSGLTELSQIVEDNEEVTSAALNDLNDRLKDTDGRVGDLEVEVEDLKRRTIETDASITKTEPSHGVTRLEVHLGDGGHLKLDDGGIYFDGDFKLDSDPDEE